MTTVAEISADGAVAKTRATRRRRRATPNADARAVGDDGSRATYTAAEVATHASATDCWVIVRGGVYDVTSFVPKHPGGNMIYVKAGGECTAAV